MTEHWQRRERLRQHIYDFLSKSKCMDCNETDVTVLQFDHQRDKHYDMSKAVRNRISIKRLEAEFEKCEIVCANCHMRRTAKTQGWYKRLNV